MLQRVGIHHLLGYFQRHAVGERGVEIGEPGAIACQQCFGIVEVEPVGRQDQFVGDAVAPGAEHLAPVGRIADGAPAVRQEQGAGLLGPGVDHRRIGKLRLRVGLAFVCGIVGGEHAQHPGAAVASHAQRQVARDARGFVRVAGKARRPVVHAGLLLLVGQRGRVLDDVDVVRIDADAQGVGVGRIARFDAHGQERDGQSAVQRFGHVGRIELAKQAIGELVYARALPAYLIDQGLTLRARVVDLLLQHARDVGRLACAQGGIERGLLRGNRVVELALLRLQGRNGLALLVQGGEVQIKARHGDSCCDSVLAISASSA